MLAHRFAATAAEAMKRLRAQYGLLLPSGLEAEKLGLVFNGEIPAGWKPIKERRAEAEKAKVKAKRDALKAEIKRRKETPTRTHNPPARSSA